MSLKTFTSLQPNLKIQGNEIMMMIVIIIIIIIIIIGADDDCYRYW